MTETSKEPSGPRAPEIRREREGYGQRIFRALVAGWHFFGRNIATIVSISSIVIAFQSLRYSIESQERDAEYKEISIQPRPTLMPLSEDMSLSVRNLGLGPAVVKQIFFEQDGRCISSYEKSTSEWENLYRPFLMKIAADVYSKSLPSMP